MGFFNFTKEQRVEIPKVEFPNMPINEEVWRKELMNSLKTLENYEKRLSKLEKENDKLKRIFKNYVPDKITYIREFDHEIATDIYTYRFYKSFRTYIYKGAKEYAIENLWLNNSTFEQGESDNIIFVTDVVLDGDEEREDKYVLDLDDCTFIKTK